MKFITVCIIDDDKIYQLTAQKMLEKLNPNINTIIFSDGEEAAQFLSGISSNKDALPDIIFLDVNMPLMNAWEFLDAYKTLKPSLAKKIIVYVISSSVSEIDIERAKSNEEVKDYIIKPITKDQYASIISSFENEQV